MIRMVNYDDTEFEKIMQGTSLICLCAGKALYELCDVYHFESKILYVIDNNKAGITLTIGNSSIPVKSFDEVGPEIKDCLLLFTSMRYINELIEQLDKDTRFDNLVFCAPKLFRSNEDILMYGSDDFKIPKSNNMIIPRIIHYCWFGHGPIPEKFQKNIDTWKRYCPDYEIIRWDESNYNIEKNKYMKQAYEKRKWGFVPDYARLDIINTYGGIYLDTDVEILRPWDDLLQYSLFCGFESRQYVALGLGFGAVRNHAVLLEMMKFYNEVEFINVDGSLNLVASPVYQTKIMKKYGLIQNGHTQNTRDFVAFAPEYFAPINAYGVGYPTANSFSIHQYAATWLDETQLKEKELFINNYKMVLDRVNKERDEV